MLELLLVLVVVALVVALAAPSLRGVASGAKAEDAAAKLLSLTRWAQSEAIAMGRPCRLNVDAQKCTYWLTMQESGAYVPVKGEYGRTNRLADGVKLDLEFDTQQEQIAAPALTRSGGGFSFASPARKAAADKNRDKSYIQFHPSGRSDVATINIRGAKGEFYRVSCPSATEPFAMASSTEEQR